MPGYTPSERALHLDHAEDGVRAVADAAIARQHDVRGFECKRGYETIVLALVTVPERRKATGYWVSTDGDDEKAVFVPESLLTRAHGGAIVTSECGGLFLLATMKAWVAIDRHLAQANMPGLLKSREWSDDQRTGWKRIQARIGAVRRELTEANKPARFRKPVYSRTDAMRSRNDVA